MTSHSKNSIGSGGSIKKKISADAISQVNVFFHYWCTSIYILVLHDEGGKKKKGGRAVGFVVLVLLVADSLQIMYVNISCLFPVTSSSRSSGDKYIKYTIL